MDSVFIFKDITCPNCNKNIVYQTPVLKRKVISFKCQHCQEKLYLIPLMLPNGNISGFTAIKKRFRTKNILVEIVVKIFPWMYKKILLKLVPSKKKGLKPSVRDKNASAITMEDVINFAKIDLPRINDPEFFKKVFGEPKKSIIPKIRIRWK